MSKSDASIPKALMGRNDKCPCRSGKKFKRCCMGKESAILNSDGKFSPIVEVDPDVVAGEDHFHDLVRRAEDRCRSEGIDLTEHVVVIHDVPEILRAEEARLGGRYRIHDQTLVAPRSDVVASLSDAAPSASRIIANPPPPGFFWVVRRRGSRVRTTLVSCAPTPRQSTCESAPKT